MAAAFRQNRSESLAACVRHRNDSRKRSILPFLLLPLLHGCLAIAAADAATDIVEAASEIADAASAVPADEDAQEEAEEEEEEEDSNDRARRSR